MISDAESVPEWFLRRWRHCGVRVHAAGWHETHARQGVRRRYSRDHWTLYGVFAGNIVFNCPNGSAGATAGEAVVLPPGQGHLDSHEAGSDGIFRLLIADFDMICDGAIANPLVGLGLPHAVTLPDRDAITAAAEELTGCFDMFRPRSPALHAWSRIPLDRLLTSYVFAGFAQGVFGGTPGAGMPRWVEDAARLVMRHLGEQALSAAEIARRCEVSVGHLSRSFVCWHGESLTAYRRRMRLTRAARFLRDQEDCEVRDIATRCGYRSASMFTRDFRRQFGMTPRAFRRGGS